MSQLNVTQLTGGYQFHQIFVSVMWNKSQHGTFTKPCFITSLLPLGLNSSTRPLFGQTPVRTETFFQGSHKKTFTSPNGRSKKSRESPYRNDLRRIFGISMLVCGILWYLGSGSKPAFCSTQLVLGTWDLPSNPSNKTRDVQPRFFSDVAVKSVVKSRCVAS